MAPARWCGRGNGRSACRRRHPGADGPGTDRRPGEVTRPLLVPGTEVRAHGGVHRADPGVDEGLDRRVGVLGRAGVVREVEHAGDAAVDGGEGGQPGADVHVLRPVDGGVAGQRGAHVSAEVVDVRHGPAQLGLPGVAMGVDEARRQDGAARVDRHRAVPPQLGTDRGDRVALDQQIGVVQDARAGVHGDDRRVGEHDAPVRIGGTAPELFEHGGVGGVEGGHGRSCSSCQGGAACAVRAVIPASAQPRPATRPPSTQVRRTPPAYSLDGRKTCVHNP